MGTEVFQILSRNIRRVYTHVTKLKIGLRHLSQDVQVQKPARQIPREKPAIKRNTFYGKGYPLLIVPVMTFGLGTWQVYRRKWKLNLIKELEEKMSMPPVPLPDNLEDVNQMEYQRVKLRGTFDHSRELFIGPRSDIREGSSSSRQSQPGVNVVTPFKLANRNETVLVNRGYIPLKERPQQLRSEGQIDGEVEITGVIRLNDKKSFFGNDPFNDGFWLQRNVDEMADIAGTSRVFIDADASSTVPGGPKGGQTQVSLRNEHLTYIITWYTLSAFTYYLWVRNFRSAVPHKTVLEYAKRQLKKR